MKKVNLSLLADEVHRGAVEDDVEGSLPHGVGLDPDAHDGVGPELLGLLLGLLDELVAHHGRQLGQVLDLAAHQALEARAHVLEEVPRPDLQDGGQLGVNFMGKES